MIMTRRIAEIMLASCSISQALVVAFSEADIVEGGLS